MLSYAQNGEDVVLQRAFADVERGFYVDVGACVPVEDSVTCHFYERGWHGVNVEPDPRYVAELEAARPRDITVQAAVGDADEPVIFYPTAVRGQGTLDADLATVRGEAPPDRVTQMTLGALLAAHAPTTGVDFLKVDVEGWEERVLRSHDWSSVRPRVVLVEAVDAVGTATHEAWEPVLTLADYRFALFDGLNRFYVAAEDADRLLPRLSVPANVIDGYRLAREANAQQALAEQNSLLQAALNGETTAGRQLQQQLDAAYAVLRTEQQEHAESRRSAQQQLAARDRSLEQAIAREVAQQAELSAQKADLTARQIEIDGLLTSTSWRLTAPVRAASRLHKVVRAGGRH